MCQKFLDSVRSAAKHLAPSFDLCDHAQAFSIDDTVILISPQSFNAFLYIPHNSAKPVSIELVERAPAEQVSVNAYKNPN
jgi:hypothetical protein